MQTKMSRFIEDNTPAKQPEDQYVSAWVENDRVIYTPFHQTRHYEESRKVVVMFPEKVVELPIPPWVYPWTPDYAYSNVGSLKMFESEAAKVAQTFIDELQKFIK